MAAESKKRGWKKPPVEDKEPRSAMKADETEPEREVKTDEKTTDEKRRPSFYDHPRSKSMKRG